MAIIEVKLDIEKDAWNWWNACNKVSHGVNWKNYIDKNISSKIHGKTQEISYEFLLPYLTELHKNSETISYVKKIQKEINEISDNLFQRMEQVTNRPMYRDKFTCFITAFPRFPYDYDQGFIWIANKKSLDFQISILIHEMLHFQYFAYFGEKVWDALGPDQHREIKEAMTVILNPEFSDITSIKDDGYTIHEKLREQLLAIWQSDPNMDRFIETTINSLKQPTELKEL